MITLLTNLFVGLYWLFTNTVFLPSFIIDNIPIITCLFLLEVVTEIWLCILIVTVFRKIKN